MRDIFAKATANAYRQPEDPKPTGAARVPVLSRDQERQTWQTELLATLRQLATTSSAEAARRTSGGILNDVLEVATRTFPADGVLVLDYNVTCGSVTIVNTATVGAVTVQAGTSSGSSAPTVGNGIQIVPAASWLAIPIGSRSVTLYGTAGNSVSVQAFTGLHAFGISR